MSSETKYCYHCCAYHVTEEMRQIVSKTGRRWRCVRSIEAARKDVDTRAAFGKRMSAQNRANARSYALRFCNAEILRLKF